MLVYLGSRDMWSLRVLQGAWPILMILGVEMLSLSRIQRELCDPSLRRNWGFITLLAIIIALITSDVLFLLFVSNLVWELRGANQWSDSYVMIVVWQIVKFAISAWYSPRERSECLGGMCVSPVRGRDASVLCDWFLSVRHCQFDVSSTRQSRE